MRRPGEVGQGFAKMLPSSQCWYCINPHVLHMRSAPVRTEINYFHMLERTQMEELGKNVCKQLALMLHPPPARLIGHETKCELGCGACISSTMFILQHGYIFTSILDWIFAAPLIFVCAIEHITITGFSIYDDINAKGYGCGQSEKHRCVPQSIVGTVHWALNWCWYLFGSCNRRVCNVQWFIATGLCMWTEVCASKVGTVHWALEALWWRLSLSRRNRPVEPSPMLKS